MAEKIATEKTSEKEKSAKKVDKKDVKKEIKKISQEEFEKRVVELSKNLTSEKIGEKLRKEGIHPKDYNKKISTILREKNLYVVPELKNVENKLEKIKAHFEKNKQDKRSMREKDRVFSQLRRIKKYHA